MRNTGGQGLAASIRDSLQRQVDAGRDTGAGRYWLSVEALRKQIAVANPAPDNLRIATACNLDAWYEAFPVVPSLRLYLEPQARLRIW